MNPRLTLASSKADEVSRPPASESILRLMTDVWFLFKFVQIFQWIMSFICEIVYDFSNSWLAYDSVFRKLSNTRTRIAQLSHYPRHALDWCNFKSLSGRFHFEKVRYSINRICNLSNHNHNWCKLMVKTKRFTKEMNFFCKWLFWISRACSSRRVMSTKPWKQKHFSVKFCVK